MQANLDLTQIWQNFESNIGHFGVSSGVERDQFTQRVVDHFYHQGLNVMVIHDTQNIASGYEIKRTVHIKNSIFGTTGFDIYVARKGVQMTVTNTGDGGFINWAFGGRFERNDMTVKFY